MKKIIICLLLAGLLTACAEDVNKTDEKVLVKNSTASEQSENEEHSINERTCYTVELDNGTVFEIGASTDDITEIFGKPMATAEAPSCIHEGVDMLYTFDGFTITTSPTENGDSYIHEISLTSDSVAFTNGLTIGSEKLVVENTFGTDYTENFGVLCFDLESVTVSVILDEDNCVSGITLTSK